MNLADSVVLSYGKIFNSGYQAHNYIGRFLARECGASVIDDPQSVRMLGAQSFRQMFFVNSAALFSKIRDPLWDIARRHAATGKPLFICINDYSVRPAKALTDLQARPNVRLLGTIKDGKGWRANCIYVNWNALSVFSGLPVDEAPRPSLFGYYGAYREGRVPYFRRYFNTPELSVPLLCGPRSKQRFRSHPSVRLIPSETSLAKFLLSLRTSLYIEDVATHAEFGSLANRFYECVSAGCIVLFDFSCIPTLERSGIAAPDYSGYLVGGPRDILKFLGRANPLAAHRKKQRDWFAAYNLGFDPGRLEQVLAKLS